MHFTEGEKYIFQVLKLVEVPMEGLFYLLRHNSGRRLLIPFEPYRKYAIEIDKPIECRIDKINCTGKVFMEPNHPLYTEGGLFPFPLAIGAPTDSGYVTVLDCFHNEIKVEIPDGLKISRQANAIELKVVKLKKGKPILSFSEGQYHRYGYLVGQELSFKLLFKMFNSYNEEVYVIQANKGPKAELKVRHFSSYGFEVGKLIDAKVISINEDGTLKVEPRNPFYEMGQEYEFNIHTVENNEANPGLVLVVEDTRRARIGIPITEEDFEAYKITTSIKCKVIGFRKGKPRLSIST